MRFHRALKSSLLAVATAIAFAAPSAAAAAPADVIYSTSTGTSFVTIDPTSGASTLLGPSGYSNVWAAALGPDGTLWTTIDGYATATIASVDKTTGHATPAPHPIGAAMVALEIAGDGTMYGIGYNDRRLYRIDKSTGIGTPVGPATGIDMGMDLAFDCHGQLWATVDGNLWTVDTTTGIATPRPSLTGIAPDVTMAMGLMFDSSCRMLVTTVNPGRLYSVDPLGAATLIGSIGAGSPHGGSIRSFTPDRQAPATTDDVPAGFQSAPVTVTLNASDAGSGVAHTYYTLGAAPAEPTTSSTVYDPAAKPTLDHGQTIRYFSVDGEGNTETPHSSAAAKVDTQAPTTTDDVPAAGQRAAVHVTLTATDNPTAAGGFAGLAERNGRDAIYYETGTGPSEPTTASPQYDPAQKPVLANGERIRYRAVDAAGNAETVRTSRAAVVPGRRTSSRLLTLHLRGRFHGRAVRSASATIDGREAKVGHAHHRFTLAVDLRGHACTIVRVRVTLHLASGPDVTLRRAFRTCRPGS